MWVNLLIFAGFSFLQPSEGSPSLVNLFDRCTLPDLLTRSAFLLISIILSCVSNCMVHRSYQRKLALGYQFAPSDLRPTPWNLVYLNFVFLVVRCIGVAVGLGGGIFIMGMLLNMNIHTNVAASIIIYQGTLLLGSAAFQFLLQGDVPLDFVAFLGLLTLACSISGDYLKVYLMRKVPRYSIIIFLLAGVIGVAVLLTVVFSIFRFINIKVDPWAFRSYCS